MLNAIFGFLERSALSLYAALVSLAIPALVFFLIGLAVKRRRLFADMRRALPESVLNLKLMIFSVVLIVPLLSLVVQALSETVVRQGLYLVAPDFWAGLPALVTLSAAVFIGDFVGYWRHRLEHTALLWPAHAVHHSDTEMTWLALERFHPINRVTTVVIDSLALWVLGFPPEALIANNLVRHYYGYFIHADLPWTYGSLGRVFVSPAMHRWHHAADPKAFDTNYATVFSIFDQAFGTFRVPSASPPVLGVTDALAPSLRSQIGYAFTPRAYRRLWQSLFGKPKD